MLRAKSEAEQSGRQPLQQRHSAEHAQRQRWRYFLGAFEDAADDPVLHEDLDRLHRPGREFTPPLNSRPVCSIWWPVSCTAAAVW